MVFTVRGAVAELERSLIADRVRAGIRNARAKGRKIGRPRVTVDAARIAALRAEGRSWSMICRETGLGKERRSGPSRQLFKIGDGSASARSRAVQSCPPETTQGLTPPVPKEPLCHDLHSQPAGVYRRCGRQDHCFSGDNTLRAP